MITIILMKMGIIIIIIARDNHYEVDKNLLAPIVNIKMITIILMTMGINIKNMTRHNHRSHHDIMSLINTL